MPTNRRRARGSRLCALALLGLVPTLAYADCNLNDSTIHIRRNIYSLAASPDGQKIIDDLRKGVAAMMKKPESDPTSWLSQADIHGVPPGDHSPPLRLWNNCQHGTYFFFSWHRMYIWYFERILRKASGDPNFALPYWNYSDDPSQAPMPAAFRDPAGRSNSLYLSNPDLRSDDANGGAPMPPDVSTYAQAFADTNFDSPRGRSGPDGVAPSFGGQIVPQPIHFGDIHGGLESQPHDVVHVWIGGQGAPGGQAPGLMSDPETAARDPIFWIHHANVDRLWKRWLDQGGRRANPLSDSEWAGQQFTFYDEDGKHCSLTGKQVVDTAAQLKYRYDDDPANPPRALMANASPTPVAPARPPQVYALMPPRANAVSLEQQQVMVPLKLTSSGETAIAPTVPSNKPLLLNVEGVDYDRSPGVYYQVYLNLPPGTKPDPKGPYYVGNLSLFALKGGTRRFDVTKVVSNLKSQGLWKADQLAVTMIARSSSHPKNPSAAAAPIAGKPRFARISLSGE